MTRGKVTKKPNMGSLSFVLALRCLSRTFGVTFFQSPIPPTERTTPRVLARVAGAALAAVMLAWRPFMNAVAADFEPFRNPDLPDEERLDDLISRLSLDEKIACLSTDPSVPRLGLRASGHVEGLHGLTLGGPGKWGANEPLPTTTFCQAMGLAATWDPTLLTRVAEVEATEARYYFHHPDFRRGGLVVRAPNADLGRDPRWGRSEECYGEDAFLTSTLAVAFVRGLQGDHPKYWKTAALLKHFLANSNEDERTSSSSDFDERLYHEYYAAPFREAIAAGSRATMTAYNAVNGIPCTIHPTLKTVMRDRWQNDGILCTDAHAMTMLVTDHRVCEDLPTAAAESIQAGISQFIDDHVEPTTQAVERGLLDEATLDLAVRRNFRVMLRLGLLDPEELVPHAQLGSTPPTELPAHRELAREVTARSIVLLENSAGLLPLAPPEERKSPLKIALFGRLADRVHQDWYGGTPPYHVTPEAGIRARLGEGAELSVVTNNDTSEVVMAARKADVCVLCLGSHPTGDSHWADVTRPSYGKEAVDRRSLELEEERLVRAVHEVNSNVVLVLISSFPYAINWSKENVPAILWLTHGGQELGCALAAVLFGDVNPGGRLVQTWPKELEQLPERLDYDLSKGHTYMYFEGEPLYPFGHGGSYTSFSYEGAETSSEEVSVGGELSLSVEVENTGERAGDDVVQVYAKFLQSKIRRPRQQLVAFERVHLQPGERRTVTLPIAAARFQHWDVETGDFVLEAGPIQLLVGRSSTDILQQTTVRVV